MGITFKCACSLILASAAPWFSPTAGHAQVPNLTLNQLDEAQLDSLAMLTGNKIHQTKRAEEERKVLVMDFFRNSTGDSSQLGSLLADRFSESLAAYSSGIQILDRRLLKDFLLENWTTLEDFKSNQICLAVARQLGATGMILGTLTEMNGNVNLTLHLEGFGLIEKEDDIFAWRDRTVVFPLTEELHSALYQSGPNYARSADKIPEEPGVFRAGIDGATSPTCVYCPDPEYADSARAAKFQGNVVLTLVVDAEGKVSRIYVLKGAPFGLTAEASKATRNWRLKPAQKDGKPVSARTSVGIGFRLSQ